MSRVPVHMPGMCTRFVDLFTQVNKPHVVIHESLGPGFCHRLWLFDNKILFRETPNPPVSPQPQ
eukprot:2923128-Amphidinium_carterae.1